MKNNKVILLTGPGGSGKSTIAKLLNNKYGYALIDGDHLDTEFFPKGGQWFPENQKKLKKAHDKILVETKREFAFGKNVVIDYIIFGDYLSFLAKFKNEFGNNFHIKILFPGEEVTIIRDNERTCWTTGSERIRIVREELSKIKKDIGEDNFIDTSKQTPDETIKEILT